MNQGNEYFAYNIFNELTGKGNTPQEAIAKDAASLTRQLDAAGRIWYTNEARVRYEFMSIC